MITGLLFLNQKAELIISRMYRTSFAAKTVADTFRTQVLGAKDFGRSPVKFFGGQSFMFIKHTNVYIVAASEGNAQVAITFQFLHTLVGVLKTYFGTIDEDSIRNNFVLIYELLDEVLDYGFPQNCTTDVLKMHITQQGNQARPPRRRPPRRSRSRRPARSAGARRASSTGRTSSSSTSWRTATCS